MRIAALLVPDFPLQALRRSYPELGEAPLVVTAGPSPRDAVVAICDEKDALSLLEVMLAHPLGSAAAIIGTVHADPQHFIQMTTAFGGRRIVDWLSGEQLPRIC